MRFIDADAFKEKLLKAQQEMKRIHQEECMDVCGSDFYSLQSFLDVMDCFPESEVVPMDFHERCLQMEIKKRFQVERRMNEIEKVHVVQNAGTICNIDHVDVLDV